MRAGTLVFDIGQNILGIYCVEDDKYTPYMNHGMVLGARRLVEAKKIISYNGNNYDLPEVMKLLSLNENTNKELIGKHIDMREICWGNEIWGSSLRSTYEMHFSACPVFPDTYEGDNHRDTYETYKLWECFNLGKLMVVDGYAI